MMSARGSDRRMPADDQRRAGFAGLAEVDQPDLTAPRPPSSSSSNDCQRAAEAAPILFVGERDGVERQRAVQHLAAHCPFNLLAEPGSMFRQNTLQNAVPITRERPPVLIARCFRFSRDFRFE